MAEEKPENKPTEKPVEKPIEKPIVVVDLQPNDILTESKRPVIPSDKDLND